MSEQETSRSTGGEEIDIQDIRGSYEDPRHPIIFQECLPTLRQAGDYVEVRGVVDGDEFSLRIAMEVERKYSTPEGDSR